MRRAASHRAVDPFGDQVDEPVAAGDDQFQARVASVEVIDARQHDPAGVNAVEFDAQYTGGIARHRLQDRFGVLARIFHQT